VQRTTFGIPLEHQHAGTFGIVGILLYDDAVPHSGDDLLHENTIRCKLVVAVLGDSDLSPFDESDDQVKCPAQDSSWTSRRERMYFVTDAGI
jgi:hypothetical protein